MAWGGGGGGEEGGGGGGGGGGFLLLCWRDWGCGRCCVWCSCVVLVGWCLRVDLLFLSFGWGVLWGGVVGVGFVLACCVVVGVLASGWWVFLMLPDPSVTNSSRWPLHTALRRIKTGA